MFPLNTIKKYIVLLIKYMDNKVVVDWGRTRILTNKLLNKYLKIFGSSPRNPYFDFKNQSCTLLELYELKLRLPKNSRIGIILEDRLRLYESIVFSPKINKKKRVFLKNQILELVSTIENEKKNKIKYNFTSKVFSVRLLLLFNTILSLGYIFRFNIFIYFKNSLLFFLNKYFIEKKKIFLLKNTTVVRYSKFNLSFLYTWVFNFFFQIYYLINIFKKLINLLYKENTTQEQKEITKPLEKIILKLRTFIYNIFYIIFKFIIPVSLSIFVFACFLIKRLETLYPNLLFADNPDFFYLLLLKIIENTIYTIYNYYYFEVNHSFEIMNYYLEKRMVNSFNFNRNYQVYHWWLLRPFDLFRNFIHHYPPDTDDFLTKTIDDMLLTSNDIEGYKFEYFESFELVEDFLNIQLDILFDAKKDLRDPKNVAASWLEGFNKNKNKNNRQQAPPIDNIQELETSYVISDFSALQGSTTVNYIDLLNNPIFTNWSTKYSNSDFIASSSIFIDNFSDIILFKNKYQNDIFIPDLFFIPDGEVSFENLNKKNILMSCADILDFKDQLDFFTIFSEVYGNEYFLKNAHYYNYASYGLWDFEYSTMVHNGGLISTALGSDTSFSSLVDHFHNMEKWDATGEEYKNISFFDPNIDIYGSLLEHISNPDYGLDDEDLNSSKGNFIVELDCESLNYDIYELIATHQWFSDFISKTQIDLDSAWESFLYKEMLDLEFGVFFNILSAFTFGNIKFPEDIKRTFNFLENYKKPWPNIYQKDCNWILTKTKQAIEENWLVIDQSLLFLKNNHLTVVDKNKILYCFFKKNKINLNYIFINDILKINYKTLYNSNFFNIFLKYIKINKNSKINTFYTILDTVSFFDDNCTINTYYIKDISKVIKFLNYNIDWGRYDYENSFLVFFNNNKIEQQKCKNNNIYVLNTINNDNWDLIWIDEELKQKKLKLFLNNLSNHYLFIKNNYILNHIYLFFNYFVKFKDNDYFFILANLLKNKSIFNIFFKNYIYFNCDFFIYQKYLNKTIFFNPIFKIEYKIISSIIKNNKNLKEYFHLKKVKNIDNISLFKNHLLLKFKIYYYFDKKEIYSWNNLKYNLLSNTNNEIIKLIFFINSQSEFNPLTDKHGIFFNKFLEEFFTYNNTNLLDLNFNESELLRLYISFLYVNGVDITNFSLNINEILFNYFNFKKLLYFFYINLDNFKKLKINNNVNYFNLKQKNNFLFNNLEKNHEINNSEFNKIFNMFWSYSKIIKNTIFSINSKYYKYIFDINLFKQYLFFENLKKKYILINSIKYSLNTDNIIFENFTYKNVDISFKLKSYSNDRDDDTKDYLCLYDDNGFNVIFKKKIKKYDKKNIYFFFKKNLIVLFKNSYFYKIYNIPELKFLKNKNKELPTFCLNNFAYSLFSNFSFFFYNNIYIKFNLYDNSYRKQIYTDIFSKNLKFSGLKLLNNFINSGYFKNCNVYLGDHLTIQNNDIPIEIIGLLAMCKNNEEPLYYKQLDKNLLINFVDLYKNNIQKKKIKNIIIFSFFYKNNINFHLNNDSTQIHGNFCKCKEVAKFKKCNYWVNFWNKYSVYDSIFKNNYYNLYLINTVHNNNLTYAPQIIYNNSNNGNLSFIHKKYDKILMRDIDKLKKSYNFNLICKKNLINTLNKSPTCFCKFNPFLGNVVYSKINKNFKNDNFFFEKKILNLINLPYFLNNYFYDKKYNNFLLTESIAKLKTEVNENPTFNKFTLHDFLRLVTNIYFNRFNKLSYHFWLDIPKISFLINSYSINYPKYTNNIIGNFSVYIIRKHTYPLIWHNIHTWFNSKLLSNILISGNLKDNYSIFYEYPILFFYNLTKKEGGLFAKTFIDPITVDFKLLDEKNNQLYSLIFKKEDIEYIVDPLNYDVGLLSSTIKPAGDKYQIENKNNISKLDQNEVFGKYFKIYEKFYKNINNNGEFLYLENSSVFLKKKLNKFKNHSILRYKKIIRKNLVLGEVFKFKIFILSYFSNKLAECKFRYIIFRINNLNFYNRNSFLLNFFLNNRKLSFKFLIKNYIIFKKNKDWFLFDKVITLLFNSYEKKLINYCYCESNNYWYFLKKPIASKNYINLKKYKKLYIRYLLNRFSYTKKTYNFENLIDCSYHTNFSTVDFLVKRKPMTYSEFSKLYKWQTYVNKQDNRYQEIHLKKFKYIYNNFYNLLKNKDKFSFNLSVFKPSSLFRIRKVYPISDFIFDCYCKLKFQNFNFIDYKIKTFEHRNIKIIDNLVKFCLNLKTINFYTKNWIKCAKLSKIFNKISKSNNKSINYFLLNFKYYIFNKKINPNNNKKYIIDWIEPNSLPPNNNAVLYIYNVLLNKNLKISFFNFNYCLKKNRIDSFKNKLLYFFLKIYTNSYYAESITNFHKNSIKLPNHFDSTNKNHSIAYHLKKKILFNFIFKNYFIFNNKKLNIDEIPLNGLSDITIKDMLYLINFKFTILYNFSLIDNLNIENTPLFFYKNFKKYFKNKYNMDLKYFSKYHNTNIYRIPFGYSNSDLYYKIWIFILYYNRNMLDYDKKQLIYCHENLKFLHSKKSKKNINNFLKKYNWSITKSSSLVVDWLTLYSNSYVNNNFFIYNNLIDVDSLYLKNNDNFYSYSDYNYIRKLDDNFLKYVNNQKNIIKNHAKEKYFLSKIFNKEIVNYKSDNQVWVYYNYIWRRNNFMKYVFNNFLKFKKLAKFNFFFKSVFNNPILFLNILKKNKNLNNLDYLSYRYNLYIFRKYFLFNLIRNINNNYYFSIFFLNGNFKKNTKLFYKLNKKILREINQFCYFNVNIFYKNSFNFYNYYFYLKNSLKNKNSKIFNFNINTENFLLSNRLGLFNINKCIRGIVITNYHLLSKNEMFNRKNIKKFNKIIKKYPPYNLLNKKCTNVANTRFYSNDIWLKYEINKLYNTYNYYIKSIDSLKLNFILTKKSNYFLNVNIKPFTITPLKPEIPKKSIEHLLNKKIKKRKLGDFEPLDCRFLQKKITKKSELFYNTDMLLKTKFNFQEKQIIRNKLIYCLMNKSMEFKELLYMDYYNKFNIKKNKIKFVDTFGWDNKNIHLKFRTLAIQNFYKAYIKSIVDVRSDFILTKKSNYFLNVNIKPFTITPLKPEIPKKSIEHVFNKKIKSYKLGDFEPLDCNFLQKKITKQQQQHCVEKKITPSNPEIFKKNTEQVFNKKIKNYKVGGWGFQSYNFLQEHKITKQQQPTICEKKIVPFNSKIYKKNMEYLFNKKIKKYNIVDFEPLDCSFLQKKTTKNKQLNFKVKTPSCINFNSIKKQKIQNKTIMWLLNTNIKFKKHLSLYYFNIFNLKKKKCIKINEIFFIYNKILQKNNKYFILRLSENLIKEILLKKNKINVISTSGWDDKNMHLKLKTLAIQNFYKDYIKSIVDVRSNVILTKKSNYFLNVNIKPFTITPLKPEIPKKSIEHVFNKKIKSYKLGNFEPLDCSFLQKKIIKTHPQLNYVEKKTIVPLSEVYKKSIKYILNQKIKSYKLKEFESLFYNFLKKRYNKLQQKLTNIEKKTELSSNSKIYKKNMEYLFNKKIKKYNFTNFEPLNYSFFKKKKIKTQQLLSYVKKKIIPLKLEIPKNKIKFVSKSVWDDKNIYWKLKTLAIQNFYKDYIKSIVDVRSNVILTKKSNYFLNVNIKPFTITPLRPEIPKKNLEHVLNKKIKSYKLGDFELLDCSFLQKKIIKTHPQLNYVEKTTTTPLSEVYKKSTKCVFNQKIKSYKFKEFEPLYYNFLKKIYNKLQQKLLNIEKKTELSSNSKTYKKNMEYLFNKKIKKYNLINFEPLGYSFLQKKKNKTQKFLNYIEKKIKLPKLEIPKNKIKFVSKSVWDDKNIYWKLKTLAIQNFYKDYIKSIADVRSNVILTKKSNYFLNVNIKPFTITPLRPEIPKKNLEHILNKKIKSYKLGDFEPLDCSFLQKKITKPQQQCYIEKKIKQPKLDIPENKIKFVDMSGWDNKNIHLKLKTLAIQNFYKDYIKSIADVRSNVILTKKSNYFLNVNIKPFTITPLRPEIPKKNLEHVLNKKIKSYKLGDFKLLDCSFLQKKTIKPHQKLFSSEKITPFFKLKVYKKNMEYLFNKKIKKHNLMDFEPLNYSFLKKKKIKTQQLLSCVKKKIIPLKLEIIKNKTNIVGTSSWDAKNIHLKFKTLAIQNFYKDYIKSIADVRSNVILTKKSNYFLNVNIKPFTITPLKPKIPKKNIEHVLNKKIKSYKLGDFELLDCSFLQKKKTKPCSRLVINKKKLVYDFLDNCNLKRNNRYFYIFLKFNEIKMTLPIKLEIIKILKNNIIIGTYKNISSPLSINLSDYILYKLKSGKLFYYSYNKTNRYFLNYFLSSFGIKKNKIKYFEIYKNLAISNKNYIYLNLLNNKLTYKLIYKLNLKNNILIKNNIFEKYRLFLERKFIFDKKKYIYLYFKLKNNELKYKNVKYIKFLLIRNFLDLTKKEYALFKNIFFKNGIYNFMFLHSKKIKEQTSKYNLIYTINNTFMFKSFFSNYFNYDSISLSLIELFNIGNCFNLENNNKNSFKYKEQIYSDIDLFYYKNKNLNKNYFIFKIKYFNIFVQRQSKVKTGNLFDREIIIFYFKNIVSFFWNPDLFKKKLIKYLTFLYCLDFYNLLFKKLYDFYNNIYKIDTFGSLFIKIYFSFIRFLKNHGLSLKTMLLNSYFLNYIFIEYSNKKIIKIEFETETNKNSTSNLEILFKNYLKKNNIKTTSLGAVGNFYVYNYDSDLLAKILINFKNLKMYENSYSLNYYFKDIFLHNDIVKKYYICNFKKIKNKKILYKFSFNYLNMYIKYRNLVIKYDLKKWKLNYFNVYIFNGNRVSSWMYVLNLWGAVRKEKINKLDLKKNLFFILVFEKYLPFLKIKQKLRKNLILKYGLLFDKKKERFINVVKNSNYFSKNSNLGEIFSLYWQLLLDNEEFMSREDPLESDPTSEYYNLDKYWELLDLPINLLPVFETTFRQEVWKYTKILDMFFDNVPSVQKKRNIFYYTKFINYLEHLKKKLNNDEDTTDDGSFFDENYDVDDFEDYFNSLNRSPKLRYYLELTPDYKVLLAFYKNIIKEKKYYTFTESEYRAFKFINKNKSNSLLFNILFRFLKYKSYLNLEIESQKRLMLDYNLTNPFYCYISKYEKSKIKIVIKYLSIYFIPNTEFWLKINNFNNFFYYKSVNNFIIFQNNKKYTNFLISKFLKKNIYKSIIISKIWQKYINIRFLGLNNFFIDNIVIFFKYFKKNNKNSNNSFFIKKNFNTSILNLLLPIKTCRFNNQVLLYFLNSRLDVDYSLILKSLSDSRLCAYLFNDLNFNLKTYALNMKFKNYEYFEHGELIDIINQNKYNTVDSLFNILDFKFNKKNKIKIFKISKKLFLYNTNILNYFINVSTGVGDSKNLQNKLFDFIYLHSVFNNFLLDNLSNVFNTFFKKILLHDNLIKKQVIRINELILIDKQVAKLNNFLTIYKHLFDILKKNDIFFKNAKYDRKSTFFLKHSDNYKKYKIKNILDYFLKTSKKYSIVLVNLKKWMFCYLYIKNTNTNFKYFKSKLKTLVIKSTIIYDPIFLFFIKNRKNNSNWLGDSLGTFLDDVEIVYDKKNYNYLWKNKKIIKDVLNFNKITDGYSQGFLQNTLIEDIDSDLGEDPNCLDMKSVWLQDNYWYSDKWFLYNNTFNYNDWISENWNIYTHYFFDDLDYDDILGFTYPYKNNLWFFSPKLLKEHKLHFDSESIYGDFFEDSYDWGIERFYNFDDYTDEDGVAFEIFEDTKFYYKSKYNKFAEFVNESEHREIFFKNTNYELLKPFLIYYIKSGLFVKKRPQLEKRFKPLLLTFFNYFINQNNFKQFHWWEPLAAVDTESILERTTSTANNYYPRHWSGFPPRNRMLYHLKKIRVVFNFRKNRYDDNRITDDNYKWYLKFISKYITTRMYGIWFKGVQEKSIYFDSYLKIIKDKRNKKKISKYFNISKFFFYIKKELYNVWSSISQIKCKLIFIFIDINTIIPDIYSYFGFRYPILEYLTFLLPMGYDFNPWIWLELYLLCKERAISAKYTTEVVYRGFHLYDRTFKKVYNHFMEPLTYIFKKFTGFQQVLRHPLAQNYQEFEKADTRDILFEAEQFIFPDSDEGLIFSYLNNLIYDIVIDYINDPITTDDLFIEQSVRFQFEKHQKNVNDNRQRYLNSCNLFLKLFLKSWWFVDDFLFISYRIDNTFLFLENYKKRIINFIKNSNKIVMSEFDNHFLYKYWNFENKNNTYIKDFEKNSNDFYKRKVDNVFEIRGFKYNFFSIMSLYREFSVFKYKQDRAQNILLGNFFFKRNKFYKNYKKIKEVIKICDDVDMEFNLNWFLIWLNTNEDYLDYRFSRYNKKRNYSFNYILNLGTESDGEDEDIDDWFCDQTENWVRNFEWHPLSENFKIWRDVSFIYNDFLELDSFWLKFNNIDEKKIINTEHNLVYSPENLEFEFINKNKKSRKKFYKNLNNNLNLKYNSITGNLQSVILNNESNVDNNVGYLNKNLDILYDKKNNIFCSFDDATNRYFNLIDNKYLIYFNKKLHYFNKHNLLNLENNNFFLDIANNIVLKKKILNLENEVYVPVDLKTLDKNILNLNTRRYTSEFKDSFNFFNNWLKKKYYNKKLKKLSFLNLNYLNLNDFCNSKIKLNNLYSFDNLKFNLFYHLNISSTNKLNLYHNTGFKFTKFYNLLKKYNESSIKTVGNFIYFTDFNLGKVNSISYSDEFLYGDEFDILDLNHRLGDNFNNFFENLIDKDTLTNFIQNPNNNLTKKNYNYFLNKFLMDNNVNQQHGFDILSISENIDFFKYFKFYKKLEKILPFEDIEEVPDDDNLNLDYDEDDLYFEDGDFIFKFLFLENKKKIANSLIKKIITFKNNKNLPHSELYNKKNLKLLLKKNKIAINYNNQRYLNFTKKIRQSFDLSSIFRNRKITNLEIFFGNSVLFDKYMQHNHPDFTISNFEKQAFNNNFENGQFLNITEIEKKPTFYDIIILGDFLNYMRYGANLLAINNNGRLPFIDYVGWIKDNENLSDGLGWTLFEDQEVAFEIDEDIKSWNNFKFIEKKIEEFDYFFEDISDKYDDFGFITIEDMESPMNTDDFWYEFNETKRLEQTNNKEEEWGEDDDLSLDNLSLNDFDFEETLDPENIKPDEETWEFLFDNQVMSDQLIRWADLNFEYNKNFLKNDYDFIVYNEVIELIWDLDYFYFFNEIPENNYIFDYLDIFDKKIIQNKNNYILDIVSKYSKKNILFKTNIKSFIICKYIYETSTLVYYEMLLLLKNFLIFNKDFFFLLIYYYFCNGLNLFFYFISIFYFTENKIMFFKNYNLSEIFYNLIDRVYTYTFTYYKFIEYKLFNFFYFIKNKNNSELLLIFVCKFYIFNLILDLFIFYNNILLSIIKILYKITPHNPNTYKLFELSVFYIIKDIRVISDLKDSIFVNNKKNSYLADLKYTSNDVGLFNIQSDNNKKFNNKKLINILQNKFNKKNIQKNNSILYIFNLYVKVFSYSLENNKNMYQSYSTGILYSLYNNTSYYVCSSIKYIFNFFFYRDSNQIYDLNKVRYFFKYFNYYWKIKNNNFINILYIKKLNKFLKCNDVLNLRDNKENIFEFNKDFGLGLVSLVYTDKESFASNIMDPYVEKISNTILWHNGSHYFVDSNTGDIKSVNSLELHLFGLYFLKINDNTSLTLDNITKLKIIKLITDRKFIFKRINKNLDLSTGLFYLENAEKNKKDYLWNEENCPNIKTSQSISNILFLRKFYLINNSTFLFKNDIIFKKNIFNFFYINMYFIYSLINRFFFFFENLLINFNFFTLNEHLHFSIFLKITKFIFFNIFLILFNISFIFENNIIFIFSLFFLVYIYFFIVFIFYLFTLTLKYIWHISF